jgi:hypothetical protein
VWLAAVCSFVECESEFLSASSTRLDVSNSQSDIGPAVLVSTQAGIHLHLHHVKVPSGIAKLTRASSASVSQKQRRSSSRSTTT